MDRSAFLAGVRDVLPVVASNVPLGMLFGATAVRVGFDPVAAVALSLFSFAAIAQLTAVELLQSGTALAVVLATILLINARYVIYSAALAPRVDHLSRRWRAVLAYPLFDLNFALATTHFEESPEDHRGWYYLGVSLPIVASFVASTAAGALAGGVLGRGLQLDFAISLVFVVVLTAQVDDRRALAVAVVAAAVSTVGVGLPFNLSLLVATIAGTAVRAVAESDRLGWRA